MTAKENSRKKALEKLVKAHKDYIEACHRFDEVFKGDACVGWVSNKIHLFYGVHYIADFIGNECVEIDRGEDSYGYDVEARTVLDGIEIYEIRNSSEEVEKG